MENKFETPILITKPLMPAKQNVFKLIETVMDSGWLTNMGHQHTLLEKEISDFLNVKNVSIFNNGTLALMVALKALNLPPNSEVITTPFTFAATTHAIAWNGLKPVFADISEDTMTLSPEAIKKAITPNTSAILPVHVYGFPCDVQAIDNIAKEHNLKVVYDAAHAFKTTIDNHSICDWGDITMLSFHATKLFNSIEGGALVYNDPELEKEIYELRNFGIKKFNIPDDIKEGIKTKDIISNIGINGKMNEFQAAWGREVLKLVDSEISARSKVADTYHELLSGVKGIKTLRMPTNTTNSMQYFPIIIDPEYGVSRDQLYSYLLQHNIYSRKYFYPLCSDFECYHNFTSSNPDNLNIANRVANNVLCLPFYGELNHDSSAHKICAVIGKLMN